MRTIAQPDVTRVTVGVDTHKEMHVASATDGLGRHLAYRMVPATPKGYEDLLSWARGLGSVEAFGVEGTGCYGKALAKFLTSQGELVIEVNRPDRSARRSNGKSDPIDAHAAARAVQSGEARVLPKAGDEKVEMIRVLRVARSTAMKARTQASNALHALVVTAPAELREQLRSLSGVELLRTASRLRPGPISSPAAATKLALRSLAQRHQALTAEIQALQARLARLTAEAAPALAAVFGVGPDVAGALLVAAGDNPDRLRSESAFAHLCGAAPIQASSGKTRRHRLNRGGDRQANSALYRIVVVRLSHDRRTKEYMARRIREGRSKPEIIRCLKRYLAREIFTALREMGATINSKNSAPVFRCG